MAAVHPVVRSLDDMPGPSGLPILGNFLDIDLEAFHQCLEQWCDEFGPIYCFRMGPRRIAVVSDPDVQKRM